MAGRKGLGVLRSSKDILYEPRLFVKWNSDSKNLKGLDNSEIVFFTVHDLSIRAFVFG